MFVHVISEFKGVCCMYPLPAQRSETRVEGAEKTHLVPGTTVFLTSIFLRKNRQIEKSKILSFKFDAACFEGFDGQSAKVCRISPRSGERDATKLKILSRLRLATLN